MVKGLEEELDMTLIIRSNKSSEVTDAGKIVMDYAKSIWYKRNLARYASSGSIDSNYHIYDESYETSCSVKHDGGKERSNIVKKIPLNK